MNFQLNGTMIARRGHPWVEPKFSSKPTWDWVADKGNSWSWEYKDYQLAL